MAGSSAEQSQVAGGSGTRVGNVDDREESVAAADASRVQAIETNEEQGLRRDGQGSGDGGQEREEGESQHTVAPANTTTTTRTNRGKRNITAPLVQQQLWEVRNNVPNQIAQYNESHPPIPRAVLDDLTHLSQVLEIEEHGLAAFAARDNVDRDTQGNMTIHHEREEVQGMSAFVQR